MSAAEALVSVTLSRGEWATVNAALSMRGEMDPRLYPIRDRIAARLDRAGFDPGAEWTRLGMRPDADYVAGVIDGDPASPSSGRES